MVGLLVGTPALAQDACSAGWPVNADRARLTDPALATIASGAPVEGAKEAAVRLTLKPWSEADLPHTPERKPASSESYAGYLTFTASGPVQISLSDAAWVDLIANGAPVSATSFTSVHDCPGIRKSLRFQLPDAPTSVVLQVSGARQPALGIVLRRRP